MEELKDLSSYLKAVVDFKASDLHISAGVPPEFRIQGKLVKAKTQNLTPKETKELCYSILSDQQKLEFEKNWELDFSFAIRDLARFRGNLFYQKGSVAGVFRYIPTAIPQFDQLGLPPVLKTLCGKTNGLVLVTGPTGSGKSTTLAAMLDVINSQTSGHIVTIEDPIEFMHPHKACVVNQREVGSDTKDFATALRRILRQDPDYILVGELRDNETVSMAITAAQTGHLVFATLHTNDATSSINRMINGFPAHQQAQVRQELSFVLQGVISQQLIPKSYESGRVLAMEVMVPNPAIRSLIRQDQIQQIYSSMQTGQSDTSMQTMNQSLFKFVMNQTLSIDDAFDYSTVPEEFEKMLEKAGVIKKKKS